MTSANSPDPSKVSILPSEKFALTFSNVLVKIDIWSSAATKSANIPKPLCFISWTNPGKPAIVGSFSKLLITTSILLILRSYNWIVENCSVKAFLGNTSSAVKATFWLTTRSPMPCPIGTHVGWPLACSIASPFASNFGIKYSPFFNSLICQFPYSPDWGWVKLPITKSLNTSTGSCLGTNRVLSKGWFLGRYISLLLFCVSITSM